jgi:hypothetical protein
MGFEPTPSAVQSQIHNVAIVRSYSKSAAKIVLCRWKHPRLFADVRVGWCTIGVHQLPVYRCADIGLHG